jgi:hypothetical protein
VFSRFNHLVRENAGFIRDGGQVFPRVWLYGLDLTTVAGMIRRRPKACIALEDGNFGTLDDPPQDRQDYEAGVNVDRSIERALLDFELDKRGLHCSYRVFCRSWRTSGKEPGWFEGACTLGWEILIVRFPEIATRWRSRLLDLPDDHDI